SVCCMLPGRRRHARLVSGWSSDVCCSELARCAVIGAVISATACTLQQGFLETSNVNAVAEITALITAQRAYEMNSKVITAADEKIGRASWRERGKKRDEGGRNTKRMNAIM